MSAATEDAGIAEAVAAADVAPSFATRYRELAYAIGGCPIERGLIGALADNECRLHGRLPGDPDPPCGCWPEEELTMTETTTHPTLPPEPPATNGHGSRARVG